MPGLFDPLKIGEITIPNRVVMAPLTRSRADGGARVPNALMAEYYAQRAEAGLILSEATSVTPMGVGYADTPGLWSDEQTQGWKIVTEAVHERGGRIYAQLWHVGRISDPSFLDGKPPVSASDVPAKGHVSLLRPERPYPTPRPLGLDEIPGVIAAYRRAAENAQKAGFDGVELHGANGYLLDQFLQDSTNKRTDEYGGPVENRARLLLEATDAAIAVFGAGRVGVHLAPRRDSHDMADSTPEKTFTYVGAQLGQRNVAFICTRERLGEDSLSPAIKRAFKGVYIANEGFTAETAAQVLATGQADAVAFGKLYIANPDLVERLRQGAALNKWDAGTFYVPGATGYTDYPALETAAAA